MKTMTPEDQVVEARLRAVLSRLPAMREEYENSPERTQTIYRCFFWIGHSAGEIEGMAKVTETVEELTKVKVNQ